ncbi:MAG: DUF2442 domain-containing protein [Bifidobacteriaceae bacterium]|nr:DUF2442 domain-containing protein [Bifidobacteriaceae bacterium]
MGQTTAKSSVRHGTKRQRVPYLDVEEVHALPGYRLWLRFSNGEVKIADVSRLVLAADVFAPVRGVEAFRGVYVNEVGGPAWLDGELDLDQCWLYEIGVPTDMPAPALADV